MRICVTGAGGYIGGWLCPELQARGHEVHASDLVHPATDDESWDTFRVFDLGIVEVTRHWLESVEPDVVIHLAALYGRVWGERDLVKTISSNAGITAMLARECDSVAARLLYASSSEVYGRSADLGPVHEYAALRPYNCYGASKKWGEEACRLYCPDGLMTVRLNMPFGGAASPPRPGEVPHTSGRAGQLGYNVAHMMTWEAEHGYPIRVHRDTERCLTWVGDTVRGMAMILESGYSGTWNVCRDDDHREVADIARMVVEITGSKSEIIVEDRPPQVTTRKHLDNLRLRSLGWRPEVDLEDGLKRTWEYFRCFDRDGVWRG